MATWYWFVIAGVAVVVIGGTIYVLTRPADDEAEMEEGKEADKAKDLSDLKLEDLAD